ncbi:DotH/IcmK family type IV secretion protein [Photobacterium damselae]|uniref:DotH/IcmK family type IV secretion protein n=1 Tax=Photobacterium damselae TaxID=38293 RepID=UPI0040687B4C
MSNFGRDSDHVEVPLKLKPLRGKEIQDLAQYQLQRRFVPLTATQGAKIKREAEEMVRIKNSPIRAPRQQSRSIDLDPNSVSVNPVIYASANFSTTIVFVDKLGKPWNVTYKGVGASDFFDIKQPNPYTLVLYPLKKYKKSNLTVILDGIVTPFIFSLDESPDQVDYIIQSKVVGISPTTNVDEFKYAPLVANIDKSMAVNDKNIDLMIDGITPSMAQPLKISKDGYLMSGMQGWSYNGSFYIKTSGKILSPSSKPVGMPNSAGESLYKIQAINNIMVERDGVVFTNVKVVSGHEA